MPGFSELGNISPAHGYCGLLRKAHWKQSSLTVKHHKGHHLGRKVWWFSASLVYRITSLVYRTKLSKNQAALDTPLTTVLATGLGTNALNSGAQEARLAINLITLSGLSVVESAISNPKTVINNACLLLHQVKCNRIHLQNSNWLNKWNFCPQKNDCNWH